MIDSSGQAQCWGYGTTGVMGDGSTAHNPTPSPITGLNHLTSIDLSYYHTCAVNGSKTVYCWRNGKSYESGNNAILDQTTAIQVTDE